MTRYRYHVDKLMAISVRMGVSRLPPQTKTVLDILLKAKNPEDISEWEILSLMNNNKELLNTKEDHLWMWGRHRRKLIKEGFISRTEE
jgi:hypothetical protein